MLTDAVEDSDSFARLFGIANIDKFTVASAQHPISATQIGQRLGGNGWHLANNLIDKIKEEKGINIKASDNRYHRTESVNTSVFHKYSEEAFELLKKVRDGQPYEVRVDTD